MEDAHVIYIRDDWAFFGVFDGHGGDKCSEFIARRYIEELEAGGPPADDRAMKDLALRLDAEFLARKEGSGSTGTFVIVTCMAGGKFKLRVGNVGDSRILLGRKSGEIYPGPGTDHGLTTDHKPDLDSERARIEAAGGTVEIVSGVARVNGDLAVSRAFGDAQHKQCATLPAEEQPVSALPELTEFECDSSDFLVLVCDGISEGSFPNAEVIKMIADKLKSREDGSPVDPRDAAMAACREALAQGSKDNLSCMVVMLSGCEKSIDEKGFIPGPFNVPDNSGFVSAYTAMAAHAGLSLEQAVELRYRSVCSDLKDLENGSDSARGPRTDDIKDSLLQEKLSYGDGPSSECGERSEESIEWFRNFIEQASRNLSTHDVDEHRQILQHMHLMNGGFAHPQGPQHAAVIRLAKVTSDIEELKRAMEEHAALKWDDRLRDACGAVGGVIVDDDQDGTSQVKFNAPLGFKAWLPTDMLEDVDS
eukprot:TRINITY_DN73172_c0_g1_i1.p1 TRINITY_DN73172_c0_g1~~TRINITY_DN73172_c0_g1_i1.p1  ORF type:complete len:534 (+),score=98.24 TRINITY_DN73172_c0_g1_i1:173-1603(+)